MSSTPSDIPTDQDHHSSSGSGTGVQQSTFTGKHRPAKRTAALACRRRGRAGGKLHVAPRFSGKQRASPAGSSCSASGSGSSHSSWSGCSLATYRSDKHARDDSDLLLLGQPARSAGDADSLLSPRGVSGSLLGKRSMSDPDLHRRVNVILLVQ